MNRLTRGALPVAFLLVLLLISLHLMSSAVQNAAEMNRLFVPLLLFIVLGLSLLMLLVLINLTHLLISYWRKVPGARLTLRMVVIFVILALVPVSVVYFYSQQFLLHGIDSWFNVEIDRAMEDALALSQASLDLHKRERLKLTRRLLSELDGISVAGLTLSLDELREVSAATELSLMDSSGRVITSSNTDPTVLVPDRPDNSILQQTRGGGNFVGLAPGEEEELMQIRTVVGDPIRGFILQALYPTSPRIGELAEKVQDAHNHYNELAYLRESLKSTFTLTLALVLIFSLLSAVWAAFFSARRLVSPIADIAEGTRAVAAGDYDTKLPLPQTRDELAFLVSSFNAMTRRVAQARNTAERSQHQAEAERAYLETVLSHLSSGVMTFDPDLRLHTLNPVACDILELAGRALAGRALAEIDALSPQTAQFLDALRPAFDTPGRDWRGEIALLGGDGRRILLCRTTPLRAPGEQRNGLVLVFDDITALIRAQRDAAWGEVARRLAHEIKNPLTPIQLSAERLRHKFLRKMEPTDAEMLDRATRTIVQQVDAMKEMVNAFSDYARPPRMHPTPLQADALVADVLELYRNDHSGVTLEAELAAPGRMIEADAGRLRQVLHNLIKNALEALDGVSAPRLAVSTRFLRQRDLDWVELRVEDNGPGFGDDIINDLFEPYVTTKVKGTGLGMAIVKKIVEEHGGAIWAENRTQGGACVILRLPAPESAPTPDTTKTQPDKETP